MKSIFIKGRTIETKRVVFLSLTLEHASQDCKNLLNTPNRYWIVGFCQRPIRRFLWVLRANRRLFIPITIVYIGLPSVRPGSY